MASCYDILRSLQDQVARNGTRIATHSGHRKRTFAELDQLSLKLSNALLVTPDMRAPSDIVVCTTYPDDVLVTAVAALRLQACCIPVLASCSVLGSVIEEQPPACLVVDTNTRGLFSGLERAHIINIDEDLAKAPLEKAPGSPTGAPKRSPSQKSLVSRPLFQIFGDGGERCSLTPSHCVSRLHWEWKAYPVNSNEVVAVLDDVNSSRFWEDALGALCVGATLAIPVAVEKRSSSSLLKFLNETHVTRMELNPDALLSLLRRISLEIRPNLTSLRLVKCSRGLLSVPLLREFAHLVPHARLVHVYEHGGACCAYECPAKGEPRHHILPEGDFVVLGKPVGLCRLFVRDDHRHDCPLGETGSIYLAGEEDAPPIETGDIGFLDTDGHLVLAGRSAPQIEGCKVDMALITKVIYDIRGVEGVVVCWERLRLTRISTVAFYWSSTPGDTTGDLLGHLAAKLPRSWLPRLFPLGSPPKEQPTASTLLREYGDAMAKLSSGGHLNLLRGAHVLMALARILAIPVARLDLSRRYTDHGASFEVCFEAAALIGHIGYQARVEELASLPVSVVVERASRSLVLPGCRTIRSSIIDGSTSFERAATLLAKCFVAKNRLDRAVGNTEDQHVHELRRIWPQLVGHRMSRVMLDDSGRILAVSLCCDLLFEPQLSKNLSEAFRAIMELHDYVERPLKEVVRMAGHRMLFWYMVGTVMDASHGDNVSLIQTLLANTLHDAKDKGFDGMCSVNSHLVTSVITENWFDFHLFDRAEPSEFEYNGGRPFAELPRGTTMGVVYRLL